MRTLYSLLWHLFLPVVLIHLTFKTRRLSAYATRWRERVGIYNVDIYPNVIWLHACSVGEVEASIPLIHALQKHHPALSFLVTTTTPTGSCRIIDEFGNTIQHVYLPYDIPFAVNSFLTRYKPQLAIIVEKEIWPNLFLQCRDRGIPLLLVNAMLSERSLQRYLRWQCLFKPVFQAISKVGSQSAAIASQFKQLGVAPDCIQVTGSLKFQRTVSEQLKHQATQLKQGQFGSRPIWIAASTHDNEEVLLLDRLYTLQSAIPDLLLILVPRHPQRGESIQRYCEKKSISYVTRSSGSACQPDASVFLLDTLGELMLFYGVAELAFVGGSLVNSGCHNLLEPAAWEIPIIFGNSVYNCEEIASALVANNAAKRVVDADQCIETVQELLSDRQYCRIMGNNAKNYIESHRSQFENTVAIVDVELEKL